MQSLWFHWTHRQDGSTESKKNALNEIIYILCSSNVLNSSSFPFQSFKLLNDISLQLDMIISNFDVYKVECINTKHMVASGIPKENGI